VSPERSVPVPRSEDELAALAIQGNQDAWGEIARRHTYRVVVSLLALGVAFEAAEDMAQEVWIRLMRQQQEGRLRELRLPGLAISQAAWLAREAARTQRRRENIRGHVSADGHAADPEQLAVDRERLDLVTRELLRCPMRFQEVFRAVYGPAGEGHAEVAQRLGLSVQRVRQIVCETRARLRSALERMEES
jgi:RNA polymerase sigma-70 factor (ECF subfamily)